MTPTPKTQAAVIDALHALGHEAWLDWPGIVAVRISKDPDVYGWTGMHDWRALEIQRELPDESWGWDESTTLPADGIDLAPETETDPNVIAQAIHDALRESE